MHATAISWVLLTLAGQIGGDFGASGYGETATGEYGPRMSVRAETRTRATTRATNPLTGSYPFGSRGHVAALRFRDAQLREHAASRG